MTIIFGKTMYEKAQVFVIASYNIVKGVANFGYMATKNIFSTIEQILTNTNYNYQTSY